MRVDLEKLLIIIKTDADLYLAINDLLYINYTKFDIISIVIEKEIPNTLINKLTNLLYFFNMRFLNIIKINIYTNNQSLIQQINSKSFFINKSYTKQFITHELQNINYMEFGKIIVFNPNMTWYNKNNIKDLL